MVQRSRGISMQDITTSSAKKPILLSFNVDKGWSEYICSDHPLYGFIQEIDAISEPEQFSLENMNAIFKKLSDLLPPEKIIWAREHVRILDHCFHFSANKSQLLLKKDGESMPYYSSYILYQEKLIPFLKEIKIKSTVSSSKDKKKFENIMEFAIADMLESVALIRCKYEKDFHAVERDLRKVLKSLNDLRNTGYVHAGDLLELKKREFLIKMELVLIYVNIGYSEHALEFAKTIRKIFQDFYNTAQIDTIDICISRMGDYYQKLIEHFFEKNLLTVIGLGNEFSEFSDSFKKRLAQENIRAAIFGNESAFSLTLKKSMKIAERLKEAQDTYKKQFLAAKKESPACKILKKTTFDFERNKLLLQFDAIKDGKIIDDVIIREAFQNIPHEKMLQPPGNIVWFSVNIQACDFSSLEKVCQRVTQLCDSKKDISEKTITRKPLNGAAEVAKSALVSSEQSVVSNALANHYQPLFSAPLETAANQKNITKKSAHAENSLDTPIEKKQHSKKSNTTQKTSSIKSQINEEKSLGISQKIEEYHWKNAKMHYSSFDKYCSVIALNSPSIPEGVWFGYIPPWIQEECHSDLFKKFQAKLYTGEICHDGIRDISKELLTREKQNYSTKYPYKFKLVIPREDNRLYGWIDDNFIDDQGKHHYLICFGCMADHKTSFLCNPETLKKKWEKRTVADQSPDCNLSMKFS